MKLTALTLALVPLVSTAPQNDPDHERNIVQLAAEAGTFQTLLAAATAAGLADTLANDGPFTVFAPTDDAFAAVPEATLAALLRPENKEKLVEVLSYHVVRGKVSAVDAVKAGKAPSLSGSELTFGIQDGRLQVAGANVVANDLAAANGTVHVVDRVLVPPTGIEPAPRGRLIIGVYTSRPSKALCEQLGIDRDGSLLITSLTGNGPAGKAGLTKYDVVVSINGKPASDAHLKEAKAEVGFGGTLDLVLYRKGKKLEKHVTVGIERH